ncbi:hypothetical protein QBC44DRAFT_366995 [Cladorrhinum sp. PSN332]|nr:hypothetical protein QBC44DRAFT_366995 [Cladorrhinum sp. PSN332]
MVNIAIAGGTGELAREVIDALLSSSTKHTILILSRSSSTSTTNPHNLPFRQVDYSDLPALARVLADSDIHTVLSFIQLLHDPDNTSQKTLIKACIQAGVTRFAPSEYGGIPSPTSLLPGWQQKHALSSYLSSLRRNTPTLEYTLFRPSLLTNYLSPNPTSKHLTPLQTPFISIPARRAVTIQDHDPYIVFTTAHDLARAVAFAVSYHQAPWPKVGGIRGQRLRLSELIGVAERVTGQKFQIETVKLKDLQAGKWTASWRLEVSHPSASQGDPEAVEQMLKQVMIGILLGSVEGCWDVSDEWNKIIERQDKGFNFTGVEEFLKGTGVPLDSKV